MDSNNNKPNILRKTLQKSEELDNKKNLYREFLEIEKKAYASWVPLLGHDLGSHSGPMHLAGVENQICSILKKVEETQLTPEESYVLLSSILFHDVGRTIENGKNVEEINKKVAEIIKKSNADGKTAVFIKIAGMVKNPDQEKQSYHHAIISALLLLQNYDEYRFEDKGLIDCVAIVCASHNLEIAQKLNEDDKLQDRFLDRHGKIRIGWLCTLLVLGDELDNSYHRTIPKWIKTKDDTKSDLREKLSGCEIDINGRLLIVHLHQEFYQKFENEDKQNKILKHILKDLNAKRELLIFWYNYLRQMHLNLMNVACSIGGHLFTSKKLKKNKSFDNIIKPLIYFQPIVEPSIRQMKIERVLDASLQLRFKSFGKTTFPWQTLATEAGFEKEEEVKQIFHRIRMLSEIFYGKPVGSDDNHILNKLKKIFPPEGSKSQLKLIFDELDGEWAINLNHQSGDQKGVTDVSQTNVQETAGEFYNWLLTIIKATSILNFNSKRLFIKNVGLAYLLNENNFDKNNCEKGIHFPHSESLLSDKNKSSVGINMVISGPAGVGKSTLAMELIKNGRIKEGEDDKKEGEDDKKSKSVCAYYSLEQPVESIREIAIGLEINEKNIIDFFIHTDNSYNAADKPDNYTPSYATTYENCITRKKEGKDDLILFLSKMPPRAYGETTDEERLFWFRFKQISRLLEATREYCAKNKNAHKLTTVVIDNLNAFTRHPLARQRVHQLFKLFSWYGVLAIFIIENNLSSGEVKMFQNEVEFLSDILIKLDWVENKYQYKTIEIAKSRCERNVLGQHPFKIRRKQKGDVPSYLQLAGKDSSNFEIYPSIHTQVSRSEKDSEDKRIISGKATEDKRKDSESRFEFSANENLNKLVHKSFKKKVDGQQSTGIDKDAFIILHGRPGGHKLVIGMDYIHGKEKKESALIINLGQPIWFEDVADSYKWGKYKSYKNLKWKINPKVSVDFYYKTKPTKNSEKAISPSKVDGAIYVLNFHAGFLLPEEFLQIVKLFIEDVSNYYDDKEYNIKRVLFNSTAHIPERYPLLADNPLILQALINMIKKKEISLLAIAVENMGRDDTIKGLSAMADLKITVHDSKDEKLPETYRETLEKRIETKLKENTGAFSNIRIISSDNVTGKDYEKRYRFIEVETNKKNRKTELNIETINISKSDSA